MAAVDEPYYSAVLACSWGALAGVAIGLASPSPTAGYGLFALLGLALLVRCHRGLLTGLAVGGLAAALAGSQWHEQRLLEPCVRVPVAVEGRVVDLPTFRPSVGTLPAAQRIRLRLSKPLSSACGNPRVLALSVSSPAPALALGDRVQAVAVLRPVASQFNPGSVPDQARNWAAGVDARGRVLELAREPGLKSPLTRARVRLREHLDGLALTPRVRGILAALVVGDGGAITPADWQRFRQLGLVHVMVISGLHIGLVWFWCANLARRSVLLICPACHQAGSVAAMFGLFAAGGYAALAGYSLPTLRAVCFLTVMQLPRLLGWRCSPLRALFVVVIALVLCQPASALTPSLWLSAGAAGILIALVTYVGEPRGIWDLIRFHTLFCLAVAPLTLFWFDGFSAMTVAANLTLVPLLALGVVPLALLGAVLLPLAESAADGVWLTAGVLLRLWLGLIDSLTDWFAGAGWLALSLDLEALVRTLALLALLVSARRGSVMRQVSMGITCLALLHQSAPAIPPAATLTVLDVGQGLAVVWQEGEEALLYDTGIALGEAFSQADKVILPYLRSRGIDTLKTLVVSHGDADHSGGVPRIKAKIPVAKHLGHGGSPCRNGAFLNWGGDTQIQVLSGTPIAGESSNDGSCVLLLNYRGRRILLAGDISARKERDLVVFWRQRLAADVLLVAHHGSATSTPGSLLKWTDPDIALISAGRHNHFGHPHAGVLARLEARGIRIAETARGGAIELALMASGDVIMTTQRHEKTPFWTRLD